jgi:hypothetical protein
MGNQVATDHGVPHISLVFGEMWDTTNLNEKCLLGYKIRRSKLTRDGVLGRLNENKTVPKGTPEHLTYS